MAQALSFPAAIHLAAVAPAVAIGVAQLFMTKGTRLHKAMGWIWVLAMVVVALSSFWIMEIRKGAGWSVIHLLSAWTLISTRRSTCTSMSRRAPRPRTATAPALACARRWSRR